MIKDRVISCKIHRGGEVLNQLFALIGLLSRGEFVSGQLLADQLGVSRATISSWVSQLSNYGLEVNKVHGRGYRLTSQINFVEKDRLLGAMTAASADRLALVDLRAETDSTNKLALAANYHDDRWQLFVSEYQTAGRGRRGKQWASPLGANLLFSLAKRAHWPHEVLYKASILVGLALAIELRKWVTCPDDVQVKWPNDVYIRGQKIAGILCELQGSPLDEALLVIGVGVNVLHEPKGEGINSTMLQRYATNPISRNKLLAKVVTRLINNFESAKLEGLDHLMSQWASLDYLKEKPIKVLLGNQMVEGVAQGINDQAELLVKLNDGEIKAFNGGEVSVRL